MNLLPLPLTTPYISLDRPTAARPLNLAEMDHMPELHTKCIKRNWPVRRPMTSDDIGRLDQSTTPNPASLNAPNHPRAACPTHHCWKKPPAQNIPTSGRRPQVSHRPLASEPTTNNPLTSIPPQTKSRPEKGAAERLAPLHRPFGGAPEPSSQKIRSWGSSEQPPSAHTVGDCRENRQ